MNSKPSFSAAYEQCIETIKEFSKAGTPFEKIVSSKEVLSLNEVLKFSKAQFYDVYEKFIHYWAFKGPYNVDYFISKFSAIPKENWAVKGTRDPQGRLDVFGHCGVAPGSVSLNSFPEAMALNALFHPEYLSAFYVNDGVMGTKFGDNPRDRIVNCLKHLKTKWQNLQFVDQPYSEDWEAYAPDTAS